MRVRSLFVIGGLALIVLLTIAWVRIGDRLLHVRPTPKWSGETNHDERSSGSPPDSSDSLPSLDSSMQSAEGSGPRHARGSLRVILVRNGTEMKPAADVLVVNDATGKIEARERTRLEEQTAVFGDLPVGTKVVVVLPHSDNLAPAYASATICEKATVEAFVSLTSGHTLRGITVDSVGRPIIGAEVNARLRLGYTVPQDAPFHVIMSTSTDGTGWSFFSSGQFRQSVRSDKDGRFSIPNVGWGPVGLSVKVGQMTCADIWVDPRAEARIVVPQ